MINRVWIVVLAMLSKDNRGWLKPDDFNRFADLTQLEIFEEYFNEYNRWLRQNSRRQAHTGYADIPANIKEKIDVFLKTGAMTYSGGTFSPPADCYRIQGVYYNGTTPVEPIKDRKLLLLNQSENLSPTTKYPVYLRLGTTFKVYPSSIQNNIEAYYIRRPLQPKWTYTTMAGNPIYDSTKPGHQDFEVHPADEYKLVAGILSKAGLVIREKEVIEYIEKEQLADVQQRNN